MNTDQIVQNFQTHLKTKQLKDWSITELEYFLEEIPTLYRYCNKEDCATLENIYIKIVDWVNEQRGFIRWSKGYLTRVKREV